MATTQGNVALIAANLYLAAFAHHSPSCIQPGVHMRLVATPADGL
jgi:hypothetical protein